MTPTDLRMIVEFGASLLALAWACWNPRDPNQGTPS